MNDFRYRQVIEYCIAATDAAITRRRCIMTYNWMYVEEYTARTLYNRRKAIRLMTQIFGVP